VGERERDGERERKREGERERKGQGVDVAEREEETARQIVL
jgi:hypothetical protein